jgi:thiamine transport system permease protein
MWPGLRRAILLAVAFATALSLGDLGAIALFGSQDVITLPYLLLQRMGSYRTDDAAGLATGPRMPVALSTKSEFSALDRA